MSNEAIETFQRAKTEHPIVRWLRSRACASGWTEVLFIAAVVLDLKDRLRNIMAHTRDRTSNKAAPSDRSATSVTRLARSNVAKKARNLNKKVSLL